MPAATEPRRSTLIFVFVTVVLDVLALGIIIPVLPNLVKDFQGGDTAAAARVVGLLGSLGAAVQFFAAPVLGAISDRFGRRPVILFSCAGLALSYVLIATATSLAALYVARVITGIASASYATASAYIADVTPPEKRAASFGMLGAAFGLGFVAGPALGVCSASTRCICRSGSQPVYASQMCFMGFLCCPSRWRPRNAQRESIGCEPTPSDL